MLTKHFFVTDVLYNWIHEFKLSCTKCMKKELIFGNCYFNNLKQFGTFDPGDLNLWPSDSRMDVWTKFEGGRSRRSRVIDRKRKGYRQTYRPTDWVTCAKQYPFSTSKRGYKNHIYCHSKNTKSCSNLKETLNRCLAKTEYK